MQKINLNQMSITDAESLLHEVKNWNRPVFSARFKGEVKLEGLPTISVSLGRSFSFSNYNARFSYDDEMGKRRTQKYSSMVIEAFYDRLSAGIIPHNP